MRLCGYLVSVALATAGCATPESDASESASTTPTVAIDVNAKSADADRLAPLKALLDEAREALQAQDFAAAREKIAPAIERTLAELSDRDDRELVDLLAPMGRVAEDAGALRAAEAAKRRVLESRSRSLPEDHVDLQIARIALADVLGDLGDLAGARALQAKALEVFSRTLPDDDPRLQSARANLAISLLALGELDAARALQEKVLEVAERTLPEDHFELQKARLNLAATLNGLNDPSSARALVERALEVFVRTRPPDDHDIQKVRVNLALTLKSLDDLAGARALEEGVLETSERTLPKDHPFLVQIRGNLASTYHLLGDLVGARALQEAVLETRTRTVPADHPDLQRARIDLAVTLHLLGDSQAARSLLERALESSLRTFPEDHPTVQWARGNLAVVLRTLGDVAGARAIEENVLEVRSRTLPDDHPDLQWARANLALTLNTLLELESARTLEEKVLEVRSRTLPEGHLDLLAALGNLGGTLFRQRDLEGARALFERAVEAAERALPEGHPDLEWHRANLAVTLRSLGDLEGARKTFEESLEYRSRTLTDDHPDLQWTRRNLAWTLALVAARFAAENDARRELGARCSELMSATCRVQIASARAALLSGSAREAEARCERLSEAIYDALSSAAGYGVFDAMPELDRDAFVLGETTRGAALAAAAMQRKARGSERFAKLRDELRAATREIATLVQRGARGDEFHVALQRRETIERELADLARTGDAATAWNVDLSTLGDSLRDEDALVAYRRYERWSARPASFVDSLCAFVVRRDGAASTEPALVRVELGPAARIEDAVRAWRSAIGARDDRGVSAVGAGHDAGRSAGEELRALVFDPLREALAGAERVIVLLDDVLHLTALDALPLRESNDSQVVGDRWRIETRSSIFELLATDAPPAATDVLVSLGAASFNSDPLQPIHDEQTASESAAHVSAILRGGAWEKGFGPLTYSGLEAREVAAIYDEASGEVGTSRVLEKREASRSALEALAPTARWLHVATHGWFAPEAIHSWKDEEPLDRHTGLGMRSSGADQVRGMSPMLLCGLALAGANLPEDEVGRAPGLITADEISILDLSSCELAVLSACDTNVGERRAGQGVASLQRALHMAGARSVITSLWKVPDEATRELMVDFYRRMWVEKKPKHQALWEAKKRLRDAKDENGNAAYSTRDWAAWVLTGAPD